MQVRVSTDDLEKERGAVMEEYRGNRNVNGRMQDAHWVLMMEGSKVLILSLAIMTIFILYFSFMHSGGFFAAINFLSYSMTEEQ